MPLSTPLNGTWPRNLGVIHLTPQFLLPRVLQGSTQERRWQQVGQPGYPCPGQQIPLWLCET